MSKRIQQKAFTLIELLVVVAVIAVLAAIIFANFGGATDRAKIGQLVSDFSEIEQALQQWGLNEGWSRWPDSDTLPVNDRGPDDNPYIRGMVAETDFGNYLDQAPEPAFGDVPYVYFQTGTFTCGDPVFRGTTIDVPSNITREVAEEVDRIIDGGDPVNLDCGKIRWRAEDGGELYYSLSDSNIFGLQ